MMDVGRVYISSDGSTFSSSYSSFVHTDFSSQHFCPKCGKPMNWALISEDVEIEFCDCDKKDKYCPQCGKEK